MNKQTQEQNTKPLIIPIFVMNSGCPQNCIFCNQKLTAGNFPAEITRSFFDKEVRSYLARRKNTFGDIEIAFYGGNFTGMNPAYQERLLSWAHSYIDGGQVTSLRVSTRPDYISAGTLSLLRHYDVTTVELGAQSFVDDVLQYAQRGHDAESIRSAIRMLKDSGFKTGLHLMAGLPLDTKEGFLYSVDQSIALKPDIVRIHPVLVLKDTMLADQFTGGQYTPLTLSNAIDYCRTAWGKFSAAGIRVIRIGVQLTPEMAQDDAILAGPVHPALGSLVLSSIYYQGILRLLENITSGVKELHFNLSDKDSSNFRGQNSSNITAIKKLYPHADIVVESSCERKRGVISLVCDQQKTYHVEIPGIN